MAFDWSSEKNKWLKENRDITFDEIVCLINEGCLLAILNHPSRSNQLILIVERDGYAYHVPCVEEAKEKYFLKTIYPSRVSTKKYIGGK